LITPAADGAADLRAPQATDFVPLPTACT
jgi:hypothetical protein